VFSGIISSVLWCGFGVAIGRLLTSDRAFRLFNYGMALALVASLIPIFIL
jgi:hypothetical protein